MGYGDSTGYAVKAGLQNANNQANVAAGAPRPIGTLAAHAGRIAEVLHNLERVRNRLGAITERVLNPIPVPDNPIDKISGERDSTRTLESSLTDLIERAERLHQSLDQIADRLDSAF